MYVAPQVSYQWLSALHCAGISSDMAIAVSPSTGGPTGPRYPGPTSLYKPRPAPGRQLPVTMGHRALALLLLVCLVAAPGDCCAPAPPATPGRMAALCWLLWVEGIRCCGVFSLAALLVAAIENQFWFIVNDNTEMARWFHIISFIFWLIQIIGLIDKEFVFGVRFLSWAFLYWGGGYYQKQSK